MNILKVLTEKRIKGNVGEMATVKHLRRMHYKILERNYVADGHEIDIIAKKRECICFVEVKTRTDDAKNEYGLRPADAVTYEKRESIIKAARSYASVCHSDLKFRFDVAEVFLDSKRQVKRINYLESAFTLDSQKRKRIWNI